MAVLAAGLVKTWRVFLWLTRSNNMTPARVVLWQQVRRNQMDDDWKYLNRLEIIEEVCKGDCAKAEEIIRLAIQEKRFRCILCVLFMCAGAELHASKEGSSRPGTSKAFCL